MSRRRGSDHEFDWNDLDRPAESTGTVQPLTEYDNPDAGDPLPREVPMGFDLTPRRRVRVKAPTRRV